MKLLVAIADYFVRTSDGGVYTGGPHHYGFWKRYLEAFDEVCVFARVRVVEHLESNVARADGEGVSFCDLPHHVGPWEYLATLSKLKAIAKAAVGGADAFLLRTGGGAVAMLAWKEIRPRGLPYGVEVLSDPWDALSPGTVKTWFRPIGRRIYVRNLVLQCRHAAAALYVTGQALQQRYPPGSQTHAIGCSDVDMPDGAYVRRPRQFHQPGRTVAFVGGLHRFDKGQDILVRAVATCCRQGLPLTLRFIGDGGQRNDLERLGRQLGIEERVIMVGQIADRSRLIREFDEADLFVLPSRVEGLPRAMVEAMGRALPCIGSTVGGIPELLPMEDLVPRGDAPALADRITQVLSDPGRLTLMSARNLKVAAEYRAEVLVPKRREFYRRLRRLSEDHGSV